MSTCTLERKKSADSSHGHSQHTNQSCGNSFTGALLLLLQEHDDGVDKDKSSTKGSPSNTGDETEISQSGGHQRDDTQKPNRHFVLHVIGALVLGGFKEIKQTISATHENERVTGNDTNRHSDTGQTHERICRRVVVENETVRGSSKGKESKGGDGTVNGNTHSKRPANDLMETSHGVVFEFLQKLGSVKVSNVGVGKHARQNEGIERKSRGCSLGAKDGRRQLRSVKLSGRSVRLGPPAESHGQCRVQHTADTDERKGCQTGQVLQKTKRQKDNTRDS
mmetsp:Transcript_4676/g.8922  ORF Transcript_4676/g.8922 Transcript_4676/m.8922 type:complete len:279 (-) Transcript_4676:672-1508(-)